MKRKLWSYESSASPIAVTYLLILFVVAMVTLFACAPKEFSPHDAKVFTTARALETAVIFYDTGMKVSGDYYKVGLLSESDKQKIIVVGNKFYDSIQATKAALKIYNSTGADIQSQLLMYTEIYGEFSNLVLPLIIKKMENN